MATKTWMAVAGAMLLGGAGCASVGKMKGSGGDENKSAAVLEQEKAEQQFQAATEAQKQAREEQSKAEQADREVEEAQKRLAEARAKARGQHLKAQKAQREAKEKAKHAHQAGLHHQEAATEEQASLSEDSEGDADERQSWNESEEVEGQVLSAGKRSVHVRGDDDEVLELRVGDGTSITMDGRSVDASNLSAGADVRASYQMVDGEATAVSIDATSSDEGGEADDPAVDFDSSDSRDDRTITDPNPAEPDRVPASPELDGMPEPKPLSPPVQ